MVVKIADKRFYKVAKFLNFWSMPFCLWTRISDRN